MNVEFIRYFNLFYAIALSVFVLTRIASRRYRIYRVSNLAYLASFLYSIAAYIFSFTIGSMPPVISALGATVQLSAMLVAITSEIEWHKHDR